MTPERSPTQRGVNWRLSYLTPSQYCDVAARRSSQPTATQYDYQLRSHSCNYCIYYPRKSLTTKLSCLFYQFRQLNPLLWCYRLNKSCCRWHKILNLTHLNLSLSLEIPEFHVGLVRFRSHWREHSRLRYRWDLEFRLDQRFCLWRRSAWCQGSLLVHRCPMWTVASSSWWNVHFVYKMR